MILNYWQWLWKLGLIAWSEFVPITMSKMPKSISLSRKTIHASFRRLTFCGYLFFPSGRDLPQYLPPCTPCRIFSIILFWHCSKVSGVLGKYGEVMVFISAREQLPSLIVVGSNKSPMTVRMAIVNTRGSLSTNMMNPVSTNYQILTYPGIWTTFIAKRREVADGRDDSIYCTMCFVLLTFTKS